MFLSPKTRLSLPPTAAVQSWAARCSERQAAWAPPRRPVALRASGRSCTAPLGMCCRVSGLTRLPLAGTPAARPLTPSAGQPSVVAGVPTLLSRPARSIAMHEPTRAHTPLLCTCRRGHPRACGPVPVNTSTVPTTRSGAHPVRRCSTACRARGAPADRTSPDPCGRAPPRCLRVARKRRICSPLPHTSHRAAFRDGQGQPVASTPPPWPCFSPRIRTGCA